MSRTVSPVSGRPYGLAVVCRVWRLARSTVYRHREPPRAAVPRRPGPVGPMPDAELLGVVRAVLAAGLAVRHDHGSQYMAHDFQRELRFLGIESSPAFVRAPEGNGCAERFIRTLKENLLWVRTFETVEELRQALLAFRETSNNSWLIKRHGFLSPAEYRRRQLQPHAQAA